MESGKVRTNPFLILVVAGLLCCAVIGSCIGYADDDPQQPEPEPPASDSVHVVADSTFRATAEDLQGEWMAQYTGFDPRQGTTSAIRRLVFFSADSSYDSHVQGILDITDQTKTYREFEHERGTYSFDEARQMMIYYIDYDSLIDFSTDRMEYHHGKLQGQAEILQYGERIIFSLPVEGKRYWIRADGNLTVPDDHEARLFYIMSNR